MVRLLCICDGPVVNSLCIMPKYMEEVHGEECKDFEEYYNILEYPIGINGDPQVIHKRHFIPLSDIDEVELLKERVVEVVDNLVADYTL